MQISDNGIALVKSFEGFRAKVYLDTANRSTIGYGHLIKAGEKFPPAGIADDTATSLLLADLHTAENTVNQLVHVTLTQNQFDALVDFTFNEGQGHFAGSHLLIYTNQGNFDLAAGEFPKWKFAGGQVSDGLLRRRKAEQKLFQTPDDSGSEQS